SVPLNVGRTVNGRQDFLANHRVSRYLAGPQEALNPAAFVQRPFLEPVGELVGVAIGPSTVSVIHNDETHSESAVRAGQSFARHGYGRLANVLGLQFQQPV